MNGKKRSQATAAEREARDQRVLDAYCVEESDFGDDLEVPCRSIVALSASPRHASERRPRLLHTQDLDELKTWIGIDDRAVPNRCLAPSEYRRELKPVCRMADEAARAGEGSEGFRARVARAEQASLKMDAIRAHTRSYLYGDSRLLKEAKPVLERFYGDFVVAIWLIPNIRIKSGSVLAFGPGANTLLASNIEIEQGGQILSSGTLTARALSAVRKVQPHVLLPALDAQYVLKTVFREVN